MGVEGVRHSSDHDAGNEDDHTEWDGTAVAGHLGATSGRCQLDLVDMWDVRCHDDVVVFPGPVPTQLLSRDRFWHPHGTPGDPGAAFAVEVVRHRDLTGEEEVGHLDTNDSDQPITEQLAENRKEMLRILF